MAKVTIVFEDGDEPDQVHTSVEFDPPAETGVVMTSAQQCGLKMLEQLRELDGDDTDIDDDCC